MHELDQICVCVPFLVCSLGVLCSGESVFWVILSLSPAFFLDFDDNDFFFLFTIINPFL